MSVPVTESERRHSGGASIKHFLIGRSCAEAFSADPTIPSGDYYVDPDGANIGDRPIIVYCNMSTGIGNIPIIIMMQSYLLMNKSTSSMKVRRW